jgi:hypothetical protein
LDKPRKLPGRLRGDAPWLPWQWEDNLPGAVAIQAVAAGQADEAQQKLALTTIVEMICQTYDLSYSPDSERDSAFAEGKRFVGLQIAKLTKLNYSNVKRDRTHG